MSAVFNTQDEDLHKQLRSPIAPLYSMTSVVSLEPLIDKTLNIFLKQLDDRYVGSSEVFDLGSWLQYFAFDVMGTLTFSRRYGFLEQGRDVHQILQEIWKFMKTVAPIGQIPWLDELWNKNSFVTLFKPSTGVGILKVVDTLISQRLAQSAEYDNQRAHKVDEKDMLSQFLDIQAANPNIQPWVPRAWTFSNILAGSDSTANVMHTIMFNLLTHPRSMESLREELLQVKSQTGLLRVCPSWEEVKGLPYLDACVMEGVRLHPPFCLPFERVVPDGGITICGTYLPAGTVVGMNPYVINRDKQTFGDDADNWRPERWSDLSRKDRKRLEHGILTINIVDPHNHKTENAWFFKQWGLQAIINKRPELPRSPHCRDDPIQAPIVDFPSSSSTVDVRVIDPGTTVDLQPRLFWDPPIRGLNKVTAPTYCFLISCGNRHVLFDMGVRQDWESFPPSVVSKLKSQTTIRNPCNVSDILDSDTSCLGVRSKDIEAIILSHTHFDHIGDPSTFPPSTDLVVGPGIRESCWPGYPTKTEASNLDSDIRDRRVQEVSFDKTAQGVVTIGSFDALDYFGDGSFYLLNAPGHSVGHICGLARVTISPDSFVFMGGDSCHHPGVLRPTRYLPLPPKVRRPVSIPASHTSECRDGKIPDRGRLSHYSCDSFFTVSPVLASDHARALETVEKIKELDASNKVFVILAHDTTLTDNIPFYPSTINDWKAKGYHLKTRWLFCAELEEALGDSS
ncbi:hypothetical protein BBP40_008642 [Aspergillus hancockii]|nr:hypothetical protein BBP40_008642 [Aspergillus hancockii]